MRGNLDFWRYGAALRELVVMWVQLTNKFDWDF